MLELWQTVATPWPSLFPGTSASPRRVWSARLEATLLSARLPPKDGLASGLRVVCPVPDAQDGDAEVQLVQALRRGDPGAAGLLWDRYAAPVRRVVQRAMGRTDADDLVQEVFLRLFAKLPSLRDPSALRAFVFTVTSSVVASEIRRRRVRRFFGLTQQGELPDVPSAPRDDDNRELLQHIYGVLDRAHPQERLAFVLRNLEGLEVTEVAQALGISLATTKRRLARMHARIHRALSANPDFAGLLRGKT